MFPKWNDWNIQYTPKGLIKHRARQTVRTVIFLAGIVGLYYVRGDAVGGVRALNGWARHGIKVGLLRLLGWVEKGVRMLPG